MPDPDDKPTIASRDEVLEILTQQARDGSVTAAAALGRELRAAKRENPDFDAELAEFLNE